MCTGEGNCSVSPSYPAMISLLVHSTDMTLSLKFFKTWMGVRVCALYEHTMSEGLHTKQGV